MPSYTLFEDEGGEFLWKDCEVPGCCNQVCLGRSERYCWPHMMSGGAEGLKTVRRDQDADTELDSAK